MENTRMYEIMSVQKERKGEIQTSWGFGITSEIASCMAQALRVKYRNDPAILDFVIRTVIMDITTKIDRG